MISKKYKLFLIPISIFAILLLYLIFATNFNGQYKIIVYHNNKNIVSECNIIASNVIMQKKPLKKLQKSFKTNKYGLYTQMNLNIETPVKKNDTIVVIFKNLHRSKTKIIQHEIISNNANKTIIPLKKVRNTINDYIESYIMSPASVFVSRLFLLIIIIGLLLKIIWNPKEISN